MAKNHVVLLGDSTIDNIYWVDDHKKCIPGILREYLNEEEWKITNYAADGFTTKNMLEGAVPHISYRVRLNDDPFPIEEGEVFEPLKELKKLHEKERVTHIILSVGGNDVRVILNRMEKLLSVFPTFQKNYEEIVNELLSITPNVIVMTQYRPSFHQDRHYRVYQAMKSIPFLGGNSGLFIIYYQSQLILCMNNNMN
jgi:lysophospholipase L1-like esterase